MDICLSCALLWVLSQIPESPQRDCIWLRTSDDEIAAALETGLERSASFSRLAREVGSAGGLVYFVRHAALPRRVKAALVPALHGTENTRYVRVLVRPDVRGTQLVAVLAHELQHAVELLGTAKNAVADTGLTTFARIGFRSGPHTWETPRAREVEEQVVKELTAFPRAEGGTKRR